MEKEVMEAYRLPFNSESYSSTNGNVGSYSANYYLPLPIVGEGERLFIERQSSSSYSGSNARSFKSIGKIVPLEKVALYHKTTHSYETITEETNINISNAHGNDGHPAYGYDTIKAGFKPVTERCFFEEHSKQQFLGDCEQKLIWCSQYPDVLCQKTFGDYYFHKNGVNQIKFSYGSWDTNNGTTEFRNMNALFEVFGPKDQSHEEFGIKTWMQAIELASKQNFKGFLELEIPLRRFKSAYFSTIYTLYHPHDSKLWEWFILGDNDPEKTRRIFKSMPKDKGMIEIFREGISKHGFNNFFRLLRQRKTLKEIAGLPAAMRVVMSQERAMFSPLKEILIAA